MGHFFDPRRHADTRSADPTSNASMFAAAWQELLRRHGDVYLSGFLNRTTTPDEELRKLTADIPSFEWLGITTRWVESILMLARTLGVPKVPNVRITDSRYPY